MIQEDAMAQTGPRHANQTLPRAAAALFAAVFTALTIPAFFQLPPSAVEASTVVPVALIARGDL
jgi:hypothetical protein